MRKSKYIITIILLLLISVPLFACERKYPAKSKSGLYFDTIISISIHDSNVTPKRKEKILSDCMDICQKYDDLLSPTLEGSDIYAINHSAGKPVVVNEDTYLLIETAIEYAQLSNGHIDPTIAKVSELWNFTKQNTYIPSETELSLALQHVGYEKVYLNPTDHSVTLTDADAAISLGFIAKGFIADKLKEHLMEQSIENASINLGGNLIFMGTHSDGNPFTAGIQMPFSDDGTLAATLVLNDKSLVTSGTYQRYFEADNTIYHHILDTSTGMPIQNNLLSVSILCTSSLEADALSTTCFVMGLEEGLNYINSLPDVEALFITSDYQLHYSNGFPR